MGLPVMPFTRVKPGGLRLRSKFQKGLALQKTINDRNFPKAQPQEQAAAPAPAAPAGAPDSFVGPKLDTSLPQDGFLPAPQLGATEPTAAPAAPASPADPGQALNQFARKALGGAEYRINRRHPAREAKIASGPFQGKTAGQATLEVEDQFRTAPDSEKQAAFDEAQGLLYTPGSESAPAASYQGFSRLRAPQKATGKPLGTTKFAKLPPR